MLRFNCFTGMEGVQIKLTTLIKRGKMLLNVPQSPPILTEYQPDLVLLLMCAQSCHLTQTNQTPPTIPSKQGPLTPKKVYYGWAPHPQYPPIPFLPPGLSKQTVLSQQKVHLPPRSLSIYPEKLLFLPTPTTPLIP